MAASTSAIQVAVRCRPFNKRELDLGSECIVSMDGPATILQHPTSTHQRSRPNQREFTFDHSFWSHNSTDPHYVTQAAVYEAIGKAALHNALDGFHTCLFAYGQTGSGKSHTMIGSDGSGGEGHGLIPRLCDDLFRNLRERESHGCTARVEVSYFEIYLERIKDLMSPNPCAHPHVREHATTGPYVEDLTWHAVTTNDMIQALLSEGNKVCSLDAACM